MYSASCLELCQIQRSTKFCTIEVGISTYNDTMELGIGTMELGICGMVGSSELVPTMIVAQKVPDWYYLS